MYWSVCVFTKVNNVLKQVNDLYTQLYPDSKAVMEGQMVLTDRQDYSGPELEQKLQYYAGWSTYYGNLIERWKFVASWIEAEQKRMMAEKTATKADKYRYQTLAKVEAELAPLTQARLIAEANKGNAFVGLNTANNQRDVIQNMIRLLVSERRHAPQ